MSNYEFENWAGDEITSIQTGTNLKRPSDHQSLFKYISLDSELSWNHLERTLHELELVGAESEKLNDPFELSPCIFDDLQPSTIAASTKYNNFTERISGKQPRPLEEVFSDVALYRDQAQKFFHSLAKRYRIIAFCERSDSSLLWSHYANSYQGACLHFLAKGLRTRSRPTLGYVTYSKYRPTYPLSLALSLSPKRNGPPIPENATYSNRAESEKILFFTKAEDWSYESELRLVYDVQRTPTVKFDKDGLVSIITGPRFSTKNRQRLDSILRGSKYYQSLIVRKARLSKTTFSVEID